MWLVRTLHGCASLDRRGDRDAHPNARAVWRVLWRCVAWGLLIGATAGAVAGSLIVPGPGTAVGLVVGVGVSAVPTTVATTVVIVTLLVRHRPLADPFAAGRDLAYVFATLVVVLLAVPVIWGISELISNDAFSGGLTTTALLLTLWACADIAVTTWVVTWMLRVAGTSILLGWSEPWGWRVATQTPSSSIHEVDA